MDPYDILQIYHNKTRANKVIDQYAETFSTKIAVLLDYVTKKNVIKYYSLTFWPNFIKFEFKTYIRVQMYAKSIEIH